jgi:hypothetical protein
MQAEFWPSNSLFAYTIRANAFLPSFNLAWVISFDKELHWKKLGRARKGENGGK